MTNPTDTDPTEVQEVIYHLEDAIHWVKAARDPKYGAADAKRMLDYAVDHLNGAMREAVAARRLERVAGKGSPWST